MLLYETVISSLGAQEQARTPDASQTQDGTTLFAHSCVCTPDSYKLGEYTRQVPCCHQYHDPCSGSVPCEAMLAI